MLKIIKVKKFKQKVLKFDFMNDFDLFTKV